MQTLIKNGETETFTAPAGGVTSGAPVLIGSVVVVAMYTAAAGTQFEGRRCGVYRMPKTAGAAWAEGQILYFDSATSSFTTAASATARRAGHADVAALSADTFGYVALYGIASPANVA